MYSNKSKRNFKSLLILNLLRFIKLDFLQTLKNMQTLCITHFHFKPQLFSRVVTGIYRKELEKL